MPGGRPKNPYTDNKATALAAKNTIVVSYSDLERIKSLCGDSDPAKDHIK